MRVKSVPAAVMLTLFLYACDGGHSRSSQPLTGLHSTVAITGKVTFDLVPFDTSTNRLDYDQTIVSPARGVLVEAIDSSDNKIASTSTDSNGYFSLEVDANTDLYIRVSARMLQTTGATWDVKVTDNTNCEGADDTKICALYVTQSNWVNSSVQSVGQSIVRNLHLASGWTGNNYSNTRAAAPFAILDAIYQAMQKVAAAARSVTFPPLEIHWSEDNTAAQGNTENGDIVTSHYNSNEKKIYILGKENTDTDEYDRHVVIHEWGHYFEDYLSRSDSLGGDHSGDGLLDLRVAFSEGLCNALSAIVTDDPFYRDSSGDQRQGSKSLQMDIESNPTSNKGWFSESSVQSIIYDLYDHNADGADNIKLGFTPIYDSLTSASYLNNPFFTSIYTFIDQLKSQQPDSLTAIDSLLNAQGIDGSGSNGDGESNDGTINYKLPIYKKAVVNDHAIEVCSINDEGLYNKLGNRTFVAFDVAIAGLYSFTATFKSGASTADPDFNLFKSGELIGIANSSSSDQESLTITLLRTGTYIVEIFDRENADYMSRNGDGGNYCFDLQITH